MSTKNWYLEIKFHFKDGTAKTAVFEIPSEAADLLAVKGLHATTVRIYPVERFNLPFKTGNLSDFKVN